MVDPVSLIVAALVAGATASAKEVAGTAIKDAYNILKDLIKHKFSGNTKAEETLADHEEDPETYEKPLKKVLTQTGADQDQSILQAAKELMAQVDSQGTAAGKYNIHNQFYGSVENNVSGGDNMQVDMRKIYSRESTSDTEK
jgi:hypothetical protein